MLHTPPPSRSCQRRIVSWLLAALLLATAALAQVPRPADEPDPALDKHLGEFLDQYAKDLQSGDSTRITDHLTADFSALVSSPNLGKDLVRMDRKAYLADLARRLSDKRFKLKTRHLVTLGRSSMQASASFEMDFLLDGKPADVALCIADLQYDGLNWRIRRLYETRLK